MSVATGTERSANPAATGIAEVEIEAAPDFRLPHGLASGRFVLAIGLILAAGLVSLLAVNTSLAAGAITLSGMESSLARKTEQQQALDAVVTGLSSPATLQQSAVSLGMVPAAAPAFLDPATGALSGALAAAVAPAKPAVPGPQVIAPTPTPSPTESSGASPGATTPSPSPAPAPAPTTPAPAVDPGEDGATLSRPDPIAGTPTNPTAANPTPPTSGDDAIVVGPVMD